MADPKKKTPRWHSATVLQATSRHLWQFSVRETGFILLQETTVPHSAPLPPRLVAKDWQGIWKPRLNLAWLPANTVFLRTLHLPTADLTEISSMVELQLEKLSPQPVAQIAWTLDLVPGGAEGMQTVVVTMVSRSVVEDFLGDLEGQGFLADRLELPLLDQLLHQGVKENGVWLYPGASPEEPWLVAWWFGGVMRQILLLNLPSGIDQADWLRLQIEQMAWAGELEGWLEGPPVWHLVADAKTAEVWQSQLASHTDQPLEGVPALSVNELAARNARRAATAQGPGLIPQEYTNRYRQQFVDRLWMRSLGAVVGIYIIGVLIYFAALQVVKYQAYRVQREVAAISQTYTNAVKTEARLQILQDRQNLKYAALESWKTIAELLPANMTLDDMVFARGRLDLVGTVVPEHLSEVFDFNDAMSKARVNDDLLFNRVTTPSFLKVANGNTVWKFSCELKNGELK